MDHCGGRLWTKFPSLTRQLFSCSGKYWWRSLVTFPWRTTCSQKREERRIHLSRHFALSRARLWAEPSCRMNDTSSTLMALDVLKWFEVRRIGRVLVGSPLVVHGLLLSNYFICLVSDLLCSLLDVQHDVLCLLFCGFQLKMYFGISLLDS